MLNKAVKILLCSVFFQVFLYADNYKHKGYEKILTNIYQGKIKDVENSITKILQTVKKTDVKNNILFLRAYSSYSRYLYKDAENTCNEVLSVDQNHRECMWLLFRVYVNRGDIDKAEVFLGNYYKNSLSLDVNIQNLLEILQATYLFESFKLEQFVPQAKKVFVKFIDGKEYKKLNIFEVEELANILFNLYQRTGKTKYLGYVLYFDDEDSEGLPEKRAKDLIEYMLLKNKFNINAYFLCSWIGNEYGQNSIVGECLRRARKINEDSPIVSFFRILRGFRPLLYWRPEQLIRRLDEITTKLPDFYPTYIVLSITYATLGYFVKAEENAWKALKLHKGDLKALSILYNIFKYKGNDHKAREILGSIVDNKYKYAQFLLEAGNQAESAARFVHSHNYYKRAYRLDRSNMGILKKYAINISRMKREKTAFKLLKKYIKMNPFDKDAMNVYKLLDKIKNEFVTIKTQNFVVKLHKTVEQSKVADVFDDTLMPFYLGEIAEKALTTLTSRYGINLPTPIHLELLTDSEDLAVRTFGIPLLGVLGSCFGPFLTTLSPKARFDLPTPFNWAAVLWHELAHSYHLYLSDFKVPRWFTEGLATYEESLADSRWFNVNVLQVFAVYRQGRLPKLSDLIFNRARISNQRIIFYDYGAIIQEYLHKTYGFAKIIELLKLWQRGLSSDKVFTQGLGKSVADISEEFDKYLEDKFKGIKLFIPKLSRSDQMSLGALVRDMSGLSKKDLKKEELEKLSNYAVVLLNTDKKNAHRIAKIILDKDQNNGVARYVSGFVQKNLFVDIQKAKEEFELSLSSGFDYANVYRELGVIYFEESDYAKAEDYLKNAIERNPYFTGDDEETNPYLVLGKIYEETKQFDKAQEIYDKYLHVDGKNYKLITKIGDKFFEIGDMQKALDYYKLAVYVKTDNPLLHFNIVRVYLKLKEYDKAFQILNILQKFAQTELQSAKKKKEKQNKKEMLARIYCTKSKIQKALGNLSSANVLAKRADKYSDSIKCVESIK